jgi:hypothetical protein
VTSGRQRLEPDEPRVLGQAHALLKPGGELDFSAVYADRRAPAKLFAGGRQPTSRVR